MIAPDDDDDLLPDDVRWWSPAALLSPEAQALAGFTFALLSMFGGGIANLVAQAVLGFTFDSSQARLHVVVPGLVLLFLALLGIWLGRQVIRGGWEEAPTWAGQLARAAVIVAVVGVVVSLVTIIGGWIANGGSSNPLVSG